MDLLHSLTLDDVLAEAAASHPLRTAVVGQDGERFTYPEMEARVHRLASSLAADVGEGDRILWIGQNSHRVLELIFVAARLGAVLCPVNWRLSETELAGIAGDTAPTVVVWQEARLGDVARGVRTRSGSTPSGTQARWVQHDANGGGDEPSYEELVAAGDSSGDSSGGSPRVQRLVDPASPVLALYTAAFDGVPKAAALTHAGLIAQNLVVGGVQEITCDTVYLNSGPLFHMATLMTTLATAHMGGTNVFTARAAPEELLRLIHEERCTDAFLMPPTMDRMIELNEDGAWDLSSLRSLPYKRAWNAMVTLNQSAWAKKPGGYGQTEVCGLATATAIGGDSVGSHGRPSPVSRVRIVDPDGEDMASGEVGEIVVRGPLVMAGYHGRPDLTEEKFRNGWHHTGDLGRREVDGSLTFIGPMTAMIKSAAENIYPVEVEKTLLAHDAVRDVCVIGVPDRTWRQRVKAVVVLEEGTEVGEDELIAFCKERIASYKKPSEVVFAESLPRTPQGIVDRAGVDVAFGGGGYPGLSGTV